MRIAGNTKRPRGGGRGEQIVVPTGDQGPVETKGVRASQKTKGNKGQGSAERERERSVRGALLAEEIEEEKSKIESNCRRCRMLNEKGIAGDHQPAEAAAAAAEVEAERSTLATVGPGSESRSGSSYLAAAG